MHRSGFTLIELVVVIAIIGLLVGGSVAGYVQLNNRQVVQTSAQGLISVMRQAQQRALSGKKPTSGCTTLTGYRVAGSGNSYTLDAVCSNATITIGSYKTSPNVIIGSAINVLFPVLTGGASGTIGNISVCTANNNVCAANYVNIINVNAGGDVSDLGLQ